MNTLMKTLLESYNINDVNYSQKVKTKVDQYWNSLTPIDGSNDPKRLNSKSVFLSKLKSAILSELPGVSTGNAEFDKLTLKEQHLLKLRNPHLIGSVIPENLNGLALSNDETRQLKKLRAEIFNDKINQEPLVISGDELLAKMMPLLLKDNLVKEVVPALLLATGRRTIEILKTAKFTLREDMKADGYKCIFSGQAKAGLDEKDCYEIPLLAPFYLVEFALQTVRRQFDATNVSAEQVHQIYARQLNTYIHKLVGVNAHALRSIYAMCCYTLNKNVSSMIGYIATILGHSNNMNAAYYQTINVEKLTGPYQHVEQAKLEAINEDQGWVFISKPESKRIDSIKEMMAQGKRITATSVRNHGGGTMAVIQKVIQNNLERIEKHNKNL